MSSGRGSAAGGNFGSAIHTAIADSVRLWRDCGGRALFASL